MEVLNDIVRPKWVYIKNGVIFNISPKNNGDKFALEITSANTPSITVDEKPKYFDSFIEVGDTYSSESGFSKTVYDSSGDSKDVSFNEYYLDICKNELAKYILDNFDIPLSEIKTRLSAFSPSKFPPFMIKGFGYTVNGIEQIDLTDKKYNDLKKDELLKRLNEVVKNTALSYQYDVTKCDIDIKLL